VATVIGLGVQFSANANGMTKGLSQVDRQLQNLGKQAAAAASLFDSFKGSTAAAGEAQKQVATDIAFLGSALKTGQISAQEYAAELQAVVGSAQTAAAAFAEGARITEQVATAEERRTAELERLGQLLLQGAISEETYARAAAEASGANQEAAAAETDRAKALSRAAQITQSNLSPQEKYDAQVQELAGHLAAGRISQDTYNSALNKAATEWAKATMAADKFGTSVDGAGDGGTMKFNELSGVLSALPGPIGNVAGRLSGLSSAGEGLSKVFGGGAGLSGGLANIGASVAGLVNPFTVGLAAVAAFGTGASAVASGLLDLEDRVETLGNTADKLGVSFEFIQTLEEAGNRSGVSIESVSSAFGKLQKTLAGADEESKAATEALGKLGISFTDLENLSPAEQIRLIGEQLQGIDDPAKRTAAAMQIFGKSGADLLPFFRQLTPAADDIQRFGAALNDVDRARIDSFGDGIDALGVAARALGQEVTVPFIQLGEGVALAAADFIGGVSQIASAIGDILAPEMNTLGNLFQALGKTASLAADVIAGGFRIVQQILEPLGGSILPSVGAGIAFINRQILIGAVANLAKFFTAASAAAVAYATSAAGASIATAALGVSIRAAINSTGVGVLVTAFGLGAGALLEWAFASDEATKAAGGIAGAAEGAAASAEKLASELAKQDAQDFKGIQDAVAKAQVVLNSAADDAERFGAAGFKAAADFQAAIRELQNQAERGILNETALAQEVDKVQQAYKRQIGVLEELAKAEDDRAAASQRAAAAAVEADRKLADAFITAQGLGGGDQVTAAETLLAITRQIEETEAAIVEARAAGDAAAEQAATRRLAVLDQAQAAAEEASQFGFSTQDAARAIASVRDELDDTFSFVNFELAPEAFTAAQEQLAQLEADLEAKVIDPQTFQQAADAIRSGFEDALRTAEKIRDLNEQYAQRAAEIDAERMDALSQVSQQTVQATDVRTSEGASEFLRLATGREDPAISEYRKQLSELQKIAREIGKLGGVVDIVGAA
jgi:hypothetical protein